MSLCPHLSNGNWTTAEVTFAQCIVTITVTSIIIFLSAKSCFHVPPCVWFRAFLRTLQIPLSEFPCTKQSRMAKDLWLSALEGQFYRVLEHQGPAAHSSITQLLWASTLSRCSLPVPTLLPLGVSSQIKYLHPHPCLRIHFQRNLNQDVHL